MFALISYTLLEQLHIHITVSDALKKKNTRWQHQPILYMVNPPVNSDRFDYIFSPKIF